jgi:hypothetical protein
VAQIGRPRMRIAPVSNKHADVGHLCPFAGDGLWCILVAERAGTTSIPVGAAHKAGVVTSVRSQGSEFRLEQLGASLRMLLSPVAPESSRGCADVLPPDAAPHGKWAAEGGGDMAGSDG